MTQKPRQPIKHCPVCGIAMLGHRSDETSPNYDMFKCLWCDTVISYGATPQQRIPKDQS